MGRATGRLEVFRDRARQLWPARVSRVTPPSQDRDLGREPIYVAPCRISYCAATAVLDRCKPRPRYAASTPQKPAATPPTINPGDSGVVRGLQTFCGDGIHDLARQPLGIWPPMGERAPALESVEGSAVSRPASGVVGRLARRLGYRPGWQGETRIPAGVGTLAAARCRPDGGLVGVVAFVRDGGNVGDLD